MATLHAFAGLTFDGGFLPLPLRCLNCGTWARPSIAVQLEGLPCHPVARRRR